MPLSKFYTDYLISGLAQISDKALKIILILIISWLTFRFTKVVIHKSVEIAQRDLKLRLSVEQFDQRVGTLSQLLTSVVKFTILAIAFMTILGVFEINLAPLLAGAGIVGVAVGFGAQNLMRDFINGFFILFENQFNVNDVIEVSNLRGKVEKLTLRTTFIRDLEGKLHIIPNGEIKTVTNLTKQWAQAIVDIDVAYSEDLDQAISVLKDECKKFAQDKDFKSMVSKEPEVLGVETLGESGVTLRIVAKTKPMKQWEVARELRKRLKKRLDKEGITIPFPQIKVWFGNQDVKEFLKKLKKD
jgi:small conductance mechanosensitive channel